MRKALVVALVLLTSAFAVDLRAEQSKFVLMASTIGPIDAGIVGALEEAFQKETGITVRHVGAGTGAALDIARQGTVDLVLVHAKSLEEKFVAEGFSTDRDRPYV
jgi:tungstate transport system substrate-binding protein